MTGLLLAGPRADVCSYARRMAADGLVVGTSGNVSVRVGELVAVTPTGVDYASLTPESIVVLDASGRVVDGALAPTSEVPMHLAVYRLAVDQHGRGVGAVVHTHAPHATAVSTLVDEVPAVHYLLAAFGGPVRVAPYATFGSDALAANAVAALRGRFGCLLANHGALTVGAGLESAYDRAVQLEWLCRVWLVAGAVGAPRLLPADELARVGDALRGYGAAGREDEGR